MIYRLLRGHRLIAAVIGTFGKLLVHVERGIQHVEEQIDGKTLQIDQLESECRNLATHAEKGKRFAAKLRELVG